MCSMRLKFLILHRRGRRVRLKSPIQSDYSGEKDAFVLTILLDPLLQGSTSSPGQPEFINPQESALITLHKKKKAGPEGPAGGFIYGPINDVSGRSVSSFLNPSLSF